MGRRPSGKETVATTAALTATTARLIEQLKKTRYFPFAPTDHIIQTALLVMINGWHINLNGRTNDEPKRNIGLDSKTNP